MTIRQDRAIAITSSMKGANVTAVAFNIYFIARRDPNMANEILGLFKRAELLQESLPDETYDAVLPRATPD